MNVGADDRHRSVYLPIVRDGLPEALDLFDFPDPNLTSPGRSESIVPTQALYMMNGDFATAQAQGMAARLERRSRDVDEQVRTAFLWAYGRPATDEELQAGDQFFREFKPTRSAKMAPTQTVRRRGGGAEPGRPQRRGPAARRNAPAGPSTTTSDPALAVFCQTLMASARFRILN